MAEEINGMREYMRIFADEHDSVFKHDKCEQVNKILKGEHANNWVYPLSDKKVLCLIVIGEQSDFSLV